MQLRCYRLDETEWNRENCSSTKIVCIGAGVMTDSSPPDRRLDAMAAAYFFDASSGLHLIEDLDDLFFAVSFLFHFGLVLSAAFTAKFQPGFASNLGGKITNARLRDAEPRIYSAIAPEDIVDGGVFRR